MSYTNCINLNYAINELDLFDNIEFKYLKTLLNPSTDYDDYDFEVDIKETPDDETLISQYCITVVKFDLDNPDYNPKDPWCRENKYIRFTKRYEYNGSSIMALNFINLWTDEESDSDEE